MLNKLKVNDVGITSAPIDVVDIFITKLNT